MNWVAKNLPNQNLQGGGPESVGVKCPSDDGDDQSIWGAPDLLSCSEYVLHGVR